MGEWIAIGKSVGRKGTNLAPDVARIGTALVAVGPDDGGIFAVPLSIDGLSSAIEGFQRTQKLPSHDGRVDPAGKTLARLNALLNPGMAPPAPAIPVITGTGRIRRMATPPAPTTVEGLCWTPDEGSLTSQKVFKWSSVAGKGRIEYFELDADVTPNWFGVIIPDGVKSTEHVHIFFHPTPAQAHLDDRNYKSKAGWQAIFHYMTDPMAKGFCAAATGQILIMPVMTQASTGTCGILPAQWESICGQILALVAAGPDVQTAEPAKVSSVVVSSFSAGIVYSATFRSRAGLGSRLKGVVDFDGITSSYNQHSIALPLGGGFPVVRMQQTDAPENRLPALASQNLFPLARPRWGDPFDKTLPKDPRAVVKAIHGYIPHTMMFLAASRTAPR